MTDTSNDHITAESLPDPDLSFEQIQARINQAAATGAKIKEILSEDCEDLGEVMNALAFGIMTAAFQQNSYMFKAFVGDLLVSTLQLYNNAVFIPDELEPAFDPAATQQ